MTRDELIEAMALLIQEHALTTAACLANVETAEWDGFIKEAKMDPEGWEADMATARAVLDLLMPPRLVWEGRAEDCYLKAETELGVYEIFVEYGDEWKATFEPHARDKPPVTLAQYLDGPAAAQAAAQSHADQAWINATRAAQEAKDE